MNRRKCRGLFAALLALALCLMAALPAWAVDGQTVYIDSAEDFVRFARNCALDTWSQGKTIVLRADISLAGQTITPAATFGGTFDGGGHTISDLALTASVSPAGLFGTIQADGCVENLNVAGSVACGGDKNTAGGIAGVNYGKIVYCSFTGMVQGNSYIGGIIGSNAAGGLIASCSFSGSVQGSSSTGGIAGSNGGTIRSCTNAGGINTTNVDTSLSISEINIDSTLDLAKLNQTQVMLTTSATGGIAGSNTGMISRCENTGTVGYEHVGYNVGGVAGSSSGYLLGCTNQGTVYGRKDVGGVVGQMEPYVAVNVSQSTKSQLQTQLSELQTLCNTATTDAGGAASSLGSQLAGMGTYLDSAANAANNLRATASLTGGADGAGGILSDAQLDISEATAGISISTPPELGAEGYLNPSDFSFSGGTSGAGSVSASAQITADASLPELSSALSGMGAQMRAIGAQASGLSGTLAEDLRAINDKIGEIRDTVFDAMDTLENRDLISDTSVQDANAVTLGAARGCKNTGSVQGDRNVGGVAGAMALEYAIDPESDISQSLSAQEQAAYELKAVLQSCVSTGKVTGKKECTATVCGRQDLGLIDACEAYGSVQSLSGDYVGGVAGISSATVQNSFAKCSLSGKNYIGGILGSGVTDSVTGGGSVVTGCVSMVEITDCEQYAGAIAGCAAGEFGDNVFVSDTLAGLDTASVAGQADPVSYRALLQREKLPEAFQTLTVRFVVDDEVIKTLNVSYGASLLDSDYPDIPPVDGEYGIWDLYPATNLHFDRTITAQYAMCIDALASDTQRSDGRPVFLVEGAFNGTDRLQAQPQALTPAAFGEISASIPDAIEKYLQNIADGHAPADHVAKSVMEQWQLRLPDDAAESHTLRYRAPDGQTENLDIYVCEDGVWNTVETTKTGSYLCFTVQGQSVQVAALSTFPVWWVWIVLAGLAALVVLLIIHLLHKCGKRRRSEMKTLRSAMQAEHAANEDALGLSQPEPEAQAAEAPTAAQPEKPRKKRRGMVWLIVAAAVIVVAAAGIFIYERTFKSSVDALMLLKTLTDRQECDVDTTVQLELGNETLSTQAHLFRTQADGYSILCIQGANVPLYFYDGAIYLENGSAYRTSDLLPDYSTLGEHLLQLFQATDVTYARENGQEVYSVAAQGESAKSLLDMLTPTIAASLTEVDSLNLCMYAQDGVLQAIDASGSCTAQTDSGTQPVTIWAEMLVQQQAAGEHAVPEAVTQAIAAGGYQGKLELTEDLLRVISAATELSRRDPLGAQVKLSANCGPIFFDTSLAWFRTQQDGRTISCIRKGALELYYSGEQAINGDGTQTAASEKVLIRCADLLDVAYRAALESSPQSHQADGVYTYTLELDAGRTRQAACAIAPEAEKLDVQYLPGTIELDVKDGKITALRAAVTGDVQIGTVDTPVSISASFAFYENMTKDTYQIPERVLQKLQQESGIS